MAEVWVGVGWGWGVVGVVGWNKGFGNHDKKKPRNGKDDDIGN